MTHRCATLAHTFKSRDRRYLAGRATTRIHRFPGVPGEERAVRNLVPQDSMGRCPREGQALMSTPTIQRNQRDDWWAQLGLSGPTGLGREDDAQQVLREYVPVGFVSVHGGDTLSLQQLVGRIDAAKQRAEQQRERAASKRRASDVAEFESAFELPGAGAVVEQGRWAGFTRGEAAAWCWNLFQYEPHGFVPPGSQLRAEALAKLRAGGLPEVFGYPERAKELVENGMTPRQYREHREQLGSRMFDSADVRHR